MTAVSYITTVYNKRREIEDCIRAQWRQAGDFEREFIVVDDGSTDGSFAFLQQLAQAEPRMRVLRKDNGGPARALNLGVREARHPLVKFVDGDDILTDDATMVLLDGFRQGAALVIGRKEPIGVSATPATFARTGGPVAFRRLDEPLAEAMDHSLSGCSEVLADRAAFLKAGGCDERIFIQDQSYIRRMLLDGAPLLLTEALTVFSPPSGESALCNHSPQIDHDNNASLMLLVLDHPEMPAPLKRLALRKCASRGWKWARRVEKRLVGTDPAFWAYAASYLPVGPITRSMFQATLEPYRRTGRVRLLD
jgi:glycosyltransferase involved in cell wall biosynthesis